MRWRRSSVLQSWPRHATLCCPTRHGRSIDVTPDTVNFETIRLTPRIDATAPDGSEVRVLLRNNANSVAHFSFRPGQISRPIRHRSIDEIWFFLSGTGELWRSNGAQQQTIKIAPDLCISIPAGTAFQIRVDSDCALTAIGTTTPPWPGENSEQEEAETVTGVWEWEGRSSAIE